MTGHTVYLHDFTKPLAQRLDQRRYTSPYRFTRAPGSTGLALGFYCESRNRAYPEMAKHGAAMSLRLDWADTHLPSYSRLQGVEYYCDEIGNQTMRPIVARLAHGRGFLAGWTMGAGMCASLEPEIHDTADDAALCAHSIAENAAERERDCQAEESARLAREEDEIEIGEHD